MGSRSDVFVAIKKAHICKIPVGVRKFLDSTVERMNNEHGIAWVFKNIKWDRCNADEER